MQAGSLQLATLAQGGEKVGKAGSGAAGGDRTHDPWLRRPILYPLSYSRIRAGRALSPIARKLPRGVGAAGAQSGALGCAAIIESWFETRGAHRFRGRHERQHARRSPYRPDQDAQAAAGRRHPGLRRAGGRHLRSVADATSESKPSGSTQAEAYALGGLAAQDLERGVAERLRKVGAVEIRDANRPLKSGEDVDKAQCAACHAQGVAGAPKFADAGPWGARIKDRLRCAGRVRPQGRAPCRRRAAATAATRRSRAQWSTWPTPPGPSSPSRRAGD